MENEKKVCEQQKQNEDYDDSDEIVTINYYDRIHRQWVKVDVTKKVKRFLQSDNKKRKRKQNEYDYYNKPYDLIFDEDRKPENNRFLVDEKQEPQFRLDYHDMLIKEDAEHEHKRVLIENAFDTLTDNQREIVEMRMKNMSYGDIKKAKKFKSDNSIIKPLKSSYKKIKKYIQNNEN